MLTLDRNGTVAAIAMGLILFFAGYSNAGFTVVSYVFVAAMLAFLVLGYLVTVVGIEKKKRLRVHQERRGVMNVLANGLTPTALALLFMSLGSANRGMAGFLVFMGFISSVAAVTGDTFGSELGVLGGKPRQILTMKKVPIGTSGGITAAGVGAELLGSLAIAVVAVPALPYWWPGASIQWQLLVVALMTIGGWIGGFVDSVFGYFEEKGIGNKYTTNFLCSVAGAAAGILMFIAI